MNSQTKPCENCKNQFTIEPDDFDFYAKLKVPVPTWCPECCLIRRLTFRNMLTLYKRRDSLTGKEIISRYSEDKTVPVYESGVWWGDTWDPMYYGRKYDFSKPFFLQLGELLKSVPQAALFNENSVNSDYCNYTTGNKNCYMVFGGDFNENCAYSLWNMNCKDSLDLFWVEKMELAYNCVDSETSYGVIASLYVRNCARSAFLFACSNCTNCLGCVNARNKSYCIFNKQYSKEEYARELAKCNLGAYSGYKKFLERFLDFKLKNIHKYAEITKSVNCSGNNIRNAKNCINCFDIYEGENLKDVVLAGWPAKDSRNSSLFGHNAELVYDSWGVYGNASNVRFSSIVQGSYDIQYSSDIFSSSNLFGCVGLRNKQYCILNKQYTKEEWGSLVPRIIKHMDEMSYRDRAGINYCYGEFPPIELSLFNYNESTAQMFYPLSKEEAIRRGYDWYDAKKRDYQITMKTEDIPDHVKNVPDSITEEIIQCEHTPLSSPENQQSRKPVFPSCNEQCTQAFKIIPQELQFYRRMNLPLPRFCPNCRHYQRLKQRNPLKLWERQCMCGGGQSYRSVPSDNRKLITDNSYTNTASHAHGTSPCPNAFQTSYAPDRQEIVYCEQCYNVEVV